MANRKEQNELFKTIWAIANDLRGAVDGWTFKAYVLGAIFYRYISEDICHYVAELQAAAGVTDFDYSAMSDEEAKTAHDMIVDEKGYFILPSQLFKNVLKTADQDENLNNRLSKIFRDIENSPGDKPSKVKIAGLFSDFAVDSTQIGSTVNLRNKLLAKLLHRVDEMKLSQNIEDNKNDVFGDAYEYLMKMYASKAGKSGGEFFTPQEVSELLAEIAAWGTNDIKKVYDPACGSGSLLLKFQKIHGRKLEGLKFYGQEINPTTYNLCRSNMFLHHVNYNDFDIQLSDTLLDPRHIDMVIGGKGPFDCIVSNPPYSLKWIGKENPLLMNDPRFADAGVLAPPSAADLAFTLHMYYHLKDSGCCAIVEFPGVLYRGGAEQKIREYLIKENAVDCIIQLPANLFFGDVTIATCIIVLKKQGRRAGDNKVLFIDASREFVKEGAKNYLSETNQKTILDYYKNRKDKQYACKLVTTDEIIANDCNLSVSSYVEQPDTREKIDIKAVNASLKQLIVDGNALNEKIDNIIKEMEG
ncbi:MAG: type I restriction-modification system subunit M [Bacteroidales bacterium]|nr:type I restriction-modification system subunit M [Bacteroidales bacterium]